MIITAVDFSEHDRSTISCSSSMAQLLDEPVLLVHVMAGTPQAKRDYGDAAQRLYAMADALKVDAFPETLDGDVVGALADLASRMRPSLLVIGGQSGQPYRGEQHAAARLSRHLHAPLLVAGDDGALAQRPFATTPLRTLVPCDLTHNVDAAIHTVRKLRERTTLACELAHYYWPPSEGAAIEEQMRLLVGEDGWSFRARPHYEGIGATIAADARERRFDLIVMATHERNVVGRALHQSVREPLLAKTTVPTLLVPIKTIAEEVQP